MRKVILNEPEYLELKTETINSANELINETGDYVGNIFTIISFGHYMKVQFPDDDFGFFVVLADSIDHMPTKSRRNQCSSEWLAKCDAELSELKPRYKNQVVKACQNIIERINVYYV